MTTEIDSEKLNSFVTSTTVLLQSCADQDGEFLSLSEAEVLAEKVVSECLNFVSPQLKESKHKLIKMKATRSEAVTVKPGNVTLNLQKLFANTSGSMLTLLGVIGHPLWIPLAVIVAFYSGYDSMKVGLTSHDIAVLVSMWRREETKFAIPFEEILSSTNDELKEHGRAKMTSVELEEVLARLTDIRCIARSNEKNHAWFLKEQIVVEYS